MANGDQARAAPEGGNAAVLARFRRRRTRARTLLFLFLLLVPLGCVGPLSLFSRVPEGAQTPLLIAALVLPLVGLGGTVLVLGDRSKYHRVLSLAEQADRMGLCFVDPPERPDSARLESLGMFGNADEHVGASNLVAGEVKGLPFAAMDYAFVVGLGQGRRVYEQTVFVLDWAAQGLPDFIVYPRSWRDQLSQLLGDQFTEMPGQVAFNQQFAVRGAGRQVAACFNHRVVELFLAEKDVTVEVRGGLLAACRIGKRARAESYSAVADWMFRLAEALRAGPK